MNAIESATRAADASVAQSDDEPDAAARGQAAGDRVDGGQASGGQGSGRGRSAARPPTAPGGSGRSASGKTRGPYRKSRRVRQNILDAALDVFAESGYRSGSLREIARRVSLSEPGVLHHFPSKEALLAAVLDNRDERSLLRVDLRSDDPAVTLRDLVGLARANASEPGVVELFCVLSAEATSPRHPAHDYFVRRYRLLRKAFTVVFTKAAQAGLLAAGLTPARAATTLIAIWDGLQVQWLLEPGAVDMGEELAEAIDRMLTEPLFG